MPAPPRHPHRLESTRERVVALLRRSSLTAGQISAHLGLTHNAVRGHLAALQREGLVREGGRQRGVSRPAVVYEIVPEAEAIFSKAYIPFVAHLLRVLRERVPASELDQIMRLVGRRFAREWPRVRGDLARRVEAASALMEDLGALNTVERLDGGLIIRGHGCLLAAAVHGRPEVCRAIESLLAELIDAPVRECCERGERPRCCFEIGVSEDVVDGPVGTTR
ncbi:MAG TPA: ArsR family transcriptional regulator [Gemmatimonadales bacterium]